jgi:hypothetical protein
MRTALLDFLETRPDGQSGDAGLSDIALEAILLNKERLTPRKPANA